MGLPEHFGNSRNDNSLAGTAANLENRPRHVSLAIDAIFGDGLFKDRLRRPRVGVIGHSIGACTGLTLAGGEPWASPQESRDEEAHAVKVTRDERVCSLVLLAPATFWFIPGSLRGVRVPILIFSGERDEITPATHAASVMDGVGDPSLVEQKAIAGAATFLS